MTTNLDQIVENAQNAIGACQGCPAQADTRGRFVNPGLLNPDGEIMFLTIDPSHYTDWSKYETWEEYNDAKSPMFYDAPGGKALQRLLGPISGIELSDCWLADAIKCPVNNDLANADIDSDAAFGHCGSYLKEEIAFVNPKVIVALGNDPTTQLLTHHYGLDIGSIKAGTRDAGTTYDVDPPVVVSPHWANGWFGRHNNREKVRQAIRQYLTI